MMMEAAKVSGFGDDRQCIDRPDAWDLSQELVVLAVPQQFVGLRFDLVFVRKVGMTFVGPSVLASKAASADNEIEAQKARMEAEAILDAGCVSHNHFWFARITIGHALRTHAWDEVERCAMRLESYTRREPLPWSNFIVAYGRVLTAWGRGQRTDALRGEIRRLQSLAVERGMLLDAEMLKKALV